MIMVAIAVILQIIIFEKIRRTVIPSLIPMKLTVMKSVEESVPMKYLGVLKHSKSLLFKTK